MGLAMLKSLARAPLGTITNLPEAGL